MRTLLKFFAAMLALQPGPSMAETVNLASGAAGETQRIAGSLDSWAALGIVVSAMVVAWLLNVRQAKFRALGTALASLCCAALAGWFFLFVVNTGFLENPKPNQTPLDSAKPALLFGQAIVAAASAIWLLIIALRQAVRSEPLALGLGNELTRYGRASRYLHWSIAILLVALVPMGIFTSIIPEGTAFRNGLLRGAQDHRRHRDCTSLHPAYVESGLPKTKALDESLTVRERKVAKVAHFALYGMMVAMPITGFCDDKLSRLSDLFLRLGVWAVLGA